MNRLQDCFDDDDAGDAMFQGMRHDPEQAAFFTGQGRHFSPALKAWMADEPCGYVDSLNVYNAPVDEPVNPINPLGT